MTRIDAMPSHTASRPAAVDRASTPAINRFNAATGTAPRAAISALDGTRFDNNRWESVSPTQPLGNDWSFVGGSSVKVTARNTAPGFQGFRLIYTAQPLNAAGQAVSIACNINSAACSNTNGGHVGPGMTADRILNAGTNPLGDYGFKWTIKAVPVSTTRLGGEMYFNAYR